MVGCGVLFWSCGYLIRRDACFDLVVLCHFGLAVILFGCVFVVLGVLLCALVSCFNNNRR